MRIRVDSEVDRAKANRVPQVQKPVLRQAEKAARAMTVIRCACGCGESLTTPDSKNRPRRFIRGHWTRTAEGQTVLMGASRPSLRGRWRKDSTHWRTGRYRARTTTDHSVCGWLHIGGCYGAVDVAHVNGDYTDNAPGNRLPLCRCHHRLLDNGRIDPRAPIMPLFVVGRDGKRRYVRVVELTG